MRDNLHNPSNARNINTLGVSPSFTDYLLSEPDNAVQLNAAERTQGDPPTPPPTLTDSDKSSPASHAQNALYPSWHGPCADPACTVERFGAWTRFQCTSTGIVWCKHE